MAEKYSVRVETDIPLKLRDGTVTYVDIFRPDAPGQFPALLTRTPYDKSSLQSRSGNFDPLRGALNGYAVVLQDVRGRYTSDGEFYTFVNEIDDGYDSVAWVASQPWCSGKVGMYGSSYVGATQWLAAKSRPPSLAGIAPTVTASDYHEGWAWQGGTFELGINFSWAGSLTGANWANLSRRLPLTGEGLDKLTDYRDEVATGFAYLPMQDVPDLKGEHTPFYYDWMAHSEYDDYWKKVSIEESHSDITVPALNIGGWYDIFLVGTINNFVRMRKMGGTAEARNGQRLIIGAWTHGGLSASVQGDYNFGLRSSALAIDTQAEILKYYDYVLKGEDNGFVDEKPVRIFVMGENGWRYEDDWPLSRAQETKYYLHSKGEANTLAGDGSLSPETPANEPPDVYAYNPLNPVPTRGGGLCCDNAQLPSGAFDQRSIEMRSDVLVYSTPPLQKAVEVTGPVTVTLYASTSGPDTDFTAKLVDVEPSGYARNLTDGIIRARFRNPRQPASLVEPNKVYEYQIDLWATSNLFKKGHQIRIEISSSNFPRFDRNTNTGGPIGEEGSFVSALQTVLHNLEHPSYVTLPVVPRE